jgi:DNA-binding transcriptional MerR regulator
MQEPPLTIGAVARRCGCPPWQIRRLFERGLLPPAPRVGAYRVIAASDLPRVEEALRAAGYLPKVASEETGGQS